MPGLGSLLSSGPLLFSATRVEPEMAREAAGPRESSFRRKLEGSIPAGRERIRIVHPQ